MNENKMKLQQFWITFASISGWVTLKHTKIWLTAQALSASGLHAHQTQKNCVVKRSREPNSDFLFHHTIINWIKLFSFFPLTFLCAQLGSVLHVMDEKKTVKHSKKVFHFMILARWLHHIAHPHDEDWKRLKERQKVASRNSQQKFLSLHSIYQESRPSLWNYKNLIFHWIQNIHTGGSWVT